MFFPVRINKIKQKMKGFLATVGPKPPRLVYAFIEVPREISNKYEWKENLNTFILDRVLYSSVFYPTEYGFIPMTKASDGDNLDIMVITTYPTFPSCLVVARPLGAISIIDSGERDYKILAVAENDPRLEKYKKLTDLPYHLLREIEDFWAHYARLQPNKKIKVGKWLGKKEAFKIITAAQKEFAQASKEK